MSIIKKVKTQANEIPDDCRDLNSLALSAANSSLEFERLLTQYKPFLWKRVSRFTESSPDERDEMMSDAMQAFHEAVVNYDQTKGHFFPFLEKVIRMRSIDSLRRLQIEP
jgi:RNA polymerase sigma factor